jgi:hypothetical protein
MDEPSEHAAYYNEQTTGLQGVNARIFAVYVWKQKSTSSKAFIGTGNY